MIRSMTGYGASTVTGAEGTVTVEARSVNSRGLKVVVKAPPSAERWEGELRELAQSRAGRGRLDLFVRVETAPTEEGRALDETRVREVLDACARLRDEFGVPGEPDVASLLHVGGLFARGGAEGAEFALDPDSLKQAAAEALDDLVAMRDREGARLAVDLRERLAGIRRAVDGAAELAPQRLERERTRLQAAVAELAGKGLDEDRLTREIALIADRWNVGEELVRARSHLEAFEEFLEAPSDEPVGKRLGFLVQELQREVNTLGAKANDPGISRLVVEAKNEIERLREQVENVE
ncbi:YicC/YloC family endoribonuclease [Candidatus Palauibacter sp.]|uniref:YicC/YloC family endoribonuclease n=1 Tax=Candidatus Palauibacter sp. TaxID=3101350 RepID=UPI003B5266A0